MSIVHAPALSRTRRWLALTVAATLAVAGCSRGSAPPVAARTSSTTATSTALTRIGNGDPTSGTRVAVGPGTTALIFPDAVNPGERVDVARADSTTPVMLGSIEVGAPRYAVTTTGTLRRPIVLDTLIHVDVDHGAPVGVRYDPQNDTWQPVGSDYTDGHLTIYLPSPGTYAWARWEWNTARTLALDTMRLVIGTDTATGSGWLFDWLSSRLQPAGVLAKGSGTAELAGGTGLERAPMLLATTAAAGVGLRAATMGRARTWLNNPDARQALLDELAGTSCQATAHSMATRQDLDRTALEGLAEAALTRCGLPAADHTISLSPDSSTALVSALAARATPPASVLTALAAAAVDLIARGRPQAATSTTEPATPDTTSSPPPTAPQLDPTVPMAPPPASTSPTPPAPTLPASPPTTAMPEPPTTLPALAVKAAPSSCRTQDKDSERKTTEEADKGKDRVEIRASGLTPGGLATIVLTSPSRIFTTSSQIAAADGTVTVAVDCSGRQPGRWLVAVSEATTSRTSRPTGFDVKN